LREWQYTHAPATGTVRSAIDVALMEHATSCTVAVLSEYSGSNLDYKMIEGPSMVLARWWEISDTGYQGIKGKLDFEKLNNYSKLSWQQLNLPWYFAKKESFTKRDISTMVDSR
jgi:hypothetical protein